MSFFPPRDCLVNRIGIGDSSISEHLVASLELGANACTTGTRDKPPRLRGPMPNRQQSLRCSYHLLPLSGADAEQNPGATCHRPASRSETRSWTGTQDRGTRYRAGHRQESRDGADHGHFPSVTGESSRSVHRSDDPESERRFRRGQEPEGVSPDDRRAGWNKGPVGTRQSETEGNEDR